MSEGIMRTQSEALAVLDEAEARPHSLDELAWHADRIMRDDRASAWERRFCAGFARTVRCYGRKPSSKQETAMRRIVAERLNRVELIDVG
jgi:hypothetical protein